MHWLGLTVAFLGRWRVVGELPPYSKMVVIAAPHTSNWDFIVMLMGVFVFRLKVCWLGKKSLFVGPFGTLLRLLGGIAIDRAQPGEAVRVLSDRFAAEERFVLLLAPEGTRSTTGHWRSGFYAIAEAAHVPVICAFADYPSRTVGMGPSFIPTGDRGADMEICREFYRDKRGKHPRHASEVRLLEE